MFETSRSRENGSDALEPASLRPTVSDHGELAAHFRRKKNDEPIAHSQCQLADILLLGRPPFQTPVLRADREIEVRNQRNADNLMRKFQLRDTPGPFRKAEGLTVPIEHQAHRLLLKYAGGFLAGLDSGVQIGLGIILVGHLCRSGRRRNEYRNLDLRILLAN